MRVGAEHLGAAVTPAERRRGIGYRLSIHLQDAIDQVQHPVVRQAGAGAYATLALSIDAEARFRHLYREDRARWMLAAVVVEASGNNRDIGLGL